MSPSVTAEENNNGDNDDNDDNDEARYIDREDVRRWHVDQFFSYLKHSQSFRELDRWIHSEGWIYRLRRELGPLAAVDASDEPVEEGAFRFRSFLTPGPDAADRLRRTPFDFAETLRRTYRHSEVRCLGAISEMRLRYRIRPRRGKPREIDVLLVRTHRGGYTIGALVDPKLRFCLLETPHVDAEESDKTEDAAGGAEREEEELAWEYWLASPQEALAALREGTPPPHATPVLEEVMEDRMGLAPPRQRPALQVARIDLEASTVRLTHREEPVRLGGRVRDLLGNQYRVVGLTDEGADFSNWANVRFRRTLEERDLDLPGDYVYITPEGERVFDPGRRGREEGRERRRQRARDREAERESQPPAEETPRRAQELPDRPVGLTYLGRDEEDRAVIRLRGASGESETLRLNRGDTLEDLRGRTFRLVQITPRRVVFADERGQGYPLPRE